MRYNRYNMSDKNNYYITTTLPYVNSDPHIGFALEIVQADVLARYHNLLGDNVIFNYGTDEHGAKIFEKAKEMDKDPQKYCDELAEVYKILKNHLDLSTTNFIRTTDKNHIKAVQEFWRRCDKNGDIYKKIYKTKYCVGCELEKTDSELVDGKCPIHPNREIEIREEENYFFRFSKYQNKLLELYDKNPEFVIPANRQKEIAIFVKDGLQDFSISRLREKMPWGVPVPNDPNHVMYVWFDALINYISTLGWPDDINNFNDFWPGTQVAGKDNLRQQSAMWQAMLASAVIPFSKQVFIHGFMTLNGQKISKSQGNTIDPIELVKKYGTDPVRYYLLSKVHPFEDSDFTYEKFEESYNADLANGLGNLVARVAKMAETSELRTHRLRSGQAEKNKKLKISKEVAKEIENFRFDNALALIWDNIKKQDIFINENQVWSLENDRKEEALIKLIDNIKQIAINLKPFLPNTSEIIGAQFSDRSIKFQKPLFSRLV
ncbi:MAG: Methionyl-tRNA synthetase [Candidatus Woesebacteria bacterium GW2011_GWC1_38_13]|uniref:Methionine--tRNA ligase n=2 Tax=Candidatus Woeseibacteriota TaxID=1752722 RepID=A0A0G0L0E3_9BACT|nr:MAG: Methionyl-tRNA synthetase [Candidatus Woesebacteria bacterium GW2011_GWC1_38_13]KKQ84477.1 MAG: Methionyl-tRNA synthetase [Candidatus Woesebacteria bacterium GW2011_GWA1_38_8]